MCDQAVWLKRRISFQILFQSKQNSNYVYGPREPWTIYSKIYWKCYTANTTNCLTEMITELHVWTVCEFTQFYRIIIILFDIEICISMD